MKRILTIFLSLSFILTVHFSQAQDAADVAEVPAFPEREVSHETGIWNGIYTKYRLTDKLFYYGEYHVRRGNYYQDMSKLYLRFGLTYLLDKYLEVTTGFVNPYNWAPDPNNTEKYDPVVPEYRTWEQLLYVQYNR
jgi:hypothetical protein